MENKFISLALFSSYLKVDDPNSSELFNLYLNSAQGIVEKYIGYSLEEKIYTRGKIGGATYIEAEAVNVSELKINGEEIEILKQSVNIILIQNISHDQIHTIEYKAGFKPDNIPDIIRLTMMRIAALMVSEEGGDIAITGKNFGADGGRTFIATRDYSKILKEIEGYRIL